MAFWPLKSQFKGQIGHIIPKCPWLRPRSRLFFWDIGGDRKIWLKLPPSSIFGAAHARVLEYELCSKLHALHINKKKTRNNRRSFCVDVFSSLSATWNELSWSCRWQGRNQLYKAVKNKIRSIQNKSIPQVERKCTPPFHSSKHTFSKMCYDYHHNVNKL